jgi:hypothetical protein
VDGADNVFTVDYDQNPGGDITLTKRDAAGALLWAARHDQTDNTRWEAAQWVATDSQGNAVVAGSSMSGYSNPVNAASILMKFGPDGRLLWRHVYESSFDGSYTRKCLIDDRDDIYVLGRAGGAGVTKVKKFSAAGAPLWSYVDADGIGAPANIKFTPDGGIVLVGRSVYGSISGFAKIDRNGNKLWSYPGVSSLTMADADGDSQGNTYLVHGEYVMNGGTVIRKLDPAGALLWARTYPTAAFRIEVGRDDRPVVCGFPNSGSGGAAFTKVDAAGNVIWANPDADGPLALLMHAQLVMDSQDNVYLAAGTLFEMAVCKVNRDGTSAWTARVTGSYANAFALGIHEDVYVVGGATARLGQDVPLDVGIVPTRTVFLGQSYPNPFRRITQIRYALRAEARASLKVFDLSGREVATLVDEVQEPGERTVPFDAGDLPAGTYYCQLRSDGIVQRRALTLLR